MKSVVADDAQRQRMVVGHQTLAGNCRYHGSCQPLGNSQNRTVGRRVIGPAAGDDHRTFCSDHQIGETLQHIPGPAGAIGWITAARFFGIYICFCFRKRAFQHLLGQGEVHRPRSAGGGDAKSTPKDFGYIVHILDDVGPLGNRFKKLQGIEFSYGLFALTGQRDIRGNEDDRHGGRIGFGDAGH